MNILKIISFVLLSTAINAQVKNTIEKTGVTESTTIYRVENEDTEMSNAIEKAKQTFGEFESSISSNNPDFKNFLIKKRYQSYKGDEFLWIANIMIYDLKKSKYIGIISNEPEYTNEVKNGDIVEINKDEISDWMYLDNNVVRGGYTLRLLRSRMNDAERKKFDIESNLIFD